MRLNLFKRGIFTSTNCPICNHDNEDVLHELTRCPHARVVWFACPLGIQSEQVNDGSFG